MSSSPAYWCPVCGKKGLPVADGPDSDAVAKRYFDLHLNRHTHNELTAFVWKMMYHNRPTRSEHSLEGAAVNGLTPVGQEASPSDG